MDNWTEIGQRIEEMVDHGVCPALLYDDNGRWALSTTGIQALPDQDGHVNYTEFFCACGDWKDTPQEAVEYTYNGWKAMDEEANISETNS